MDASDVLITQHGPINERQYYLDWLRITAILLVFIFHSFRFFDAENWHLKNDIVSLNLTIFLSFLTAIGMPVFFVIAGMGTFYSLQVFEKTGIRKKDYISLRFIRLMIPFSIGLVTHIPLQVYLERLSNNQFSGSFFDFYPTYFNGIYELGGNFSIFGHHLWFLVLLFVFSLVTIKFFTNLQQELNRSVNFWYLRNQKIIYLFPIVIFSSEIIWSAITDIPLFGGWNLFSLLIMYIIGFFLSFDPKLRENIDKHIKFVVIINLISFIGLIMVVSAYSQDIFYPAPDEVFYSEFFFWLFRSIFSWTGILIILFLGKLFLNKDYKYRKSLNELVLPFYILHQTILIVIGYFIIQYNFKMAEKYIFITFLSFGLIIILLLIIRKENTLRFIFGMRRTEETSLWKYFKSNKNKIAS